MLPNLPTQKGYISIVLIVFALLFAVLIFPYKFPTKKLTLDNGSKFCQDFINDPNATTISIPSGVDKIDLVTYKLIKKDVPVNPSSYLGDHHVIYAGDTTVNDKIFRILYTKEAGKSSNFNTSNGKTVINFDDYGLVFLLHLKADGTPETIGEGTPNPLEVIDIYQDITKPPLPQVQEILKCVDYGPDSSMDPVVVMPDQKTSANRDQVQLEWFVIKPKVVESWWTPECKPAIYLYPKQKQLVNVKVFPQGQLTFVDPPYDAEKGWTVTAFPDGKLEVQSYKFKVQSYDYLYYESKIRDEAIKKPEKGWVVKYGELKALYQSILPKLGLNSKETLDFIDYWIKALPEAPYYFVSIVDQKNVSDIERLEIIPKPDSINRVRVYFERLDSPKTVTPPDLSSMNHEPITNNFRVTEWGGMVKNDLNHPFTCSQ